MKRGDIFAKMFEFEFCEPDEKVSKEQELNDIYAQACSQTGKPLYVLKPAILKLYPRYRFERLRNELPFVPPTVRDD